MNLIRVGWVVVASIVRVSLGQEERLVDCSGFDLDGPSLRATVAGVDDPLGREQVIDPRIELNFLVELDGRLQNPFSEPISSQLDLNLTVIVQHPGGTLEVADTASLVLDGGPIAPGQSVGFKIDGQNLVRQLNGSADITDLGGIARLYADAISIRVGGEVSLFSAAGGVVSLIDADVTEGVVRLVWEQMTNNAIRGWNQTAPAAWFSDRIGHPLACQPSAKLRFLVPSMRRVPWRETRKMSLTQCRWMFPADHSSSTAISRSMPIVFELV